MSLLEKSGLSATKKKARINHRISYALSETILLVVGILIAVSINNWNEQRTRNNELNNILKIVKNDLEADVSEAGKVNKYYLKYLPYIEAVLTGKVDENYYKDNPNMPFVIMGFPEMSLQRRGFGLLQEYIDAGNLSSNPMVGRIAAFYNNSSQEVRVDDELRSSDQYDNLMSWKNNQSWWPEFSFSKKTDGFIKYALTDSDYLNRVASYHLIHYQVFLPEVDKYSKEAKKLIELISTSETRRN